MINLDKYYAKAGNPPLHKEVTKAIIVRSFNGQKNVPINDIIDEVLAFHSRRSSNMPCDFQYDMRRRLFVSKALSELRKAGLAYKVISFERGTWSFVSVESLDKEPLGNSTTANLKIEKPKVELECSNSSAHDEIGEFIYVVFNDADRELAELKGLTFWPVKIGRSLQPWMRTGVTTYLYAKPRVLKFKVSNCKAAELYIHRCLQRHRINSEGLGIEWFNSNPETIQTLIAKFESALDEAFKAA